MSRYKYTAEHLNFIRTAYAKMSVRDLVPIFNAAFGLEKSLPAIKAVLKKHSIICGRKGSARLMPCRLYTPEQAQFLRENYKDRSVADLTALFNEHFGGKKKTQQQIRTFVHRQGITSGRTGRFEKGCKPWNLGKKGYMGANATSFKKGNRPPNQKPLWSERPGKDGYIEMKVPERNPYTGFPTRYKHKHVYVWEKAHGPVPRGHVVVFRDGNIRNFNPDNLMLLSRCELLNLNLHGYKNWPDQLKPSVLALARMEAKARIRLCPARGR